MNFELKIEFWIKNWWIKKCHSFKSFNFEKLLDSTHENLVNWREGMDVAQPIWLSGESGCPKKCHFTAKKRINCILLLNILGIYLCSWWFKIRNYISFLKIIIFSFRSQNLEHWQIELLWFQWSPKNRNSPYIIV